MMGRRAPADRNAPPVYLAGRTGVEKSVRWSYHSLKKRALQKARLTGSQVKPLPCREGWTSPTVIP